MGKHKLKNALLTVAWPLCVWLLFEILCRSIAGRSVFASTLDINNYIRNVGISTCVALALSFNLGSGRFDLSLGAQRMVATVVGGNIALSLGLGSAGVILFSLLFGILFGGVVGLVFVAFRVPPMVLGIGMALVYECIAFASSDANGLQLFGKGCESLSNITFTIVIVMLVTVFVGVLMQYTAFGYQMRAIQGSQKIAYNSGINVFKHAFLCYALAGGVVSFSGVFDAAFKGAMTTELGFSSNSAIMANCFPMFLGKFLARWSNESIGILIATMTLKMLNTGLGVLAMEDNTIQLLNMALFLLFLIFRANENILTKRKACKTRVLEARGKLKIAAAHRDVM